MSFFQEIEGEAAVLVENGVYRQTTIHTRNGYLYAKAAGGFVRLYADGSTTKARMRLDHLSFGGRLCADRLGKLCIETVGGATPLPEPKVQRLLIGAET